MIRVCRVKLDEDWFIGQNAARVISPGDLDESIVTPELSPGILHQPVRFAVLYSVPNSDNTMVCLRSCENRRKRQQNNGLFAEILDRQTDRQTEGQTDKSGPDLGWGEGGAGPPFGNSNTFFA